MTKEWHEHWDGVLALHRQRIRLYSGLGKAKQAVLLEHQLRTRLAALIPNGPLLSPDWNDPDQVFAALLVYLLSRDPASLEPARAGLAELEHSAADPEATDLRRALSYVQCLVPDPVATDDDRATLLARVTEISGVEAPAGDPAVTGDQTALSEKAVHTLLIDHDATELLSQTPDNPEQGYVLALGLAARQGELQAFDQLVALESTVPEWVMAAYVLAGSPMAVERLIAALQTPHLAAHAAQPWELLSGGCLTWRRAMGVAGKRKTAGPKMPVIEPVLNWWDEHGTEDRPCLMGRPTDNSGIHYVLRFRCGEATRPIWWLWQWQHRTTQAPPSILGWHTDRLRYLGDAAPGPVNAGASREAV